MFVPHRSHSIYLSNMTFVNQTSSACPTTASPPLGTFLNDTFGVIFIGYSISCAILGILTAQVANYYQQYTIDPFALKIVVRFLSSMITDPYLALILTGWNNLVPIT
jgi:hypothetical protein